MRLPARDFGSVKTRPPFGFRCSARRTVSVPASKSMSDHIRPSASPCRKPRASATDHRATFLGAVMYSVPSVTTTMGFLAAARIACTCSMLGAAISARGELGRVHDGGDVACHVAALHRNLERTRMIRWHARIDDGFRPSRQIPVERL